MVIAYGLIIGLSLGLTGVAALHVYRFIATGRRPKWREWAAAAALGVALISCGREVTAPDAAERVARGLSFITSFPSLASATSAASLVPFARVRVLFRHSDGSVALDTVVSYSSNDAEQVEVSFNIRLLSSAPSSGESMTVSLSYVTSSGDTVFRAGPSSVVVVPTRAGAPAPSPVALTVQYSGAGANAASVRITPRTLSVPAGDPFSLTAAAADASGATLPNTPIAWRSLDATAATITAVTSGAGTAKLVRGAARIVAELLTGQADTATLTITPKLGAIASVSGNAQSGPGGASLSQPVVVRTTATDGLALAGVTVTFAASTGGSVGSASVVTDANGLAQTTWQLAPTLGAQTLTATATGLGTPVSFTATSTSGPAARLSITTPPVDGIAGAALIPVVASVLDAAGNKTTFSGPVTMALGGAPAGVSLLGTTTVNAVNGVATFSALRIRRAATGYTLTASAPSLVSATSPAFGVGAAPAFALSLSSGDGQADIVGNLLASPIVALVSDSCGNPVSGFPLSFSVSTGGGSMTPASATTGADGTASSRWTLGALAGMQVMAVRGAGLTPPSVGAVAMASPLTQLQFVAQPTNVTAGVLMSPSVTARAVNAAGVTDTTFTGNITLAFGSNPSAATLGGTLTVAAVRGVATFNSLRIRKVGSGFTLTASATGWGPATSSTFNVTTAPAAAVSASSGSGQTGPTSTALTNPLVALVSDSCGNPVSGASVTWGTTSGSLSPASGTTGANGTTSTTWTLGAAGGAVSATATVASLSPATFSATANAPPAVYSMVWNGSVSTDWSTFANWTPSGTPTTADSILIPNVARQPSLTVQAGTGKMTIASGATLSLNGFDLNLNGPTDVQGLISGAGIVWSNPGTSLGGNFAVGSMYLWQDTPLLGDVTNTGNLTTSGGGALAPNGHTLTISGNATTKLKMVNATDSVYVSGNLTVNTTAATTTLTAGTLVIGGNFVQAGNYQSFPARGTHKVVMKGTSVAQHIQSFFPQNRYSHFNDLVIDNPAGVVFDSVSFDNGSSACGTPTCGGFNEVSRHLTILNGTLSGARGTYLRLGGTLTDALGGRLTVPRVYLDSTTSPVSASTPSVAVPKLYLDGTYSGTSFMGGKRMSLLGNLTVTGELIYTHDDTLKLNGHSLTITKQVNKLCCVTAGAIEMTNSADVLTANGQFYLPLGIFTAGTLYADSAMIIERVQASGTHKVVRRGTGSSYFSAGTTLAIDSTAGSWLNNVELANTNADTLMIGGGLLIKGTLSKSTATPTVFAGQNSLPGNVVVNGLSVTQPTVWNRVPLVIAGGGSVTFGSATFNNDIHVNAEDLAFGGTPQTHLSIIRGITGSYTFSGLSFSLTSSLPTPQGNVWGFVNVAGPAGLSVSLTGATPSASGGGTAKSTTSGGATLSWAP